MTLTLFLVMKSEVVNSHLFENGSKSRHLCFVGVGTVVSGTCLKGTITLNDVLLLGPDPLGHFQQIAIKSIHRKRMPVRQVRAGQTASFSLKKVRIRYIAHSQQVFFKLSFLNTLFVFFIADKTFSDP